MRIHSLHTYIKCPMNRLHSVLATLLPMYLPNRGSSTQLSSLLNCCSDSSHWRCASASSLLSDVSSSLKYPSSSRPSKLLIVPKPCSTTDVSSISAISCYAVVCYACLWRSCLWRPAVKWAFGSKRGAVSCILLGCFGLLVPAGDGGLRFHGAVLNEFISVEQNVFPLLMLIVLVMPIIYI